MYTKIPVQLRNCSTKNTLHFTARLFYTMLIMYKKS
jgi:hypothetical protein